MNRKTSARNDYPQLADISLNADDDDVRREAMYALVEIDELRRKLAKATWMLTQADAS